MTLQGLKWVGGVALAMNLLSGCIIKEEDDPEETAGSGGTGGDAVSSAGSGGEPPEGGGGASASGGASGASGGGAVGAADCDAAEVLPPAITEAVTYGPGCVRIDNTEVNDAGALTFAPGTRVEFLPGGFLSIGRYGGSATLSAVGTEAEPITFTSSNPNPRAGDWQCIHLDGDGSELDHVVVEYGGAACGATGAGREGMVQVYGSPRGITHSALRDSSTVAVQLGGTPTLFQNNTFERNTLAPIRASANSLTSIGTPNTFDAGDVILVESALVTRTGTWANHGIPYRFLAGFGAQGAITVAAGVEIQMTDGSLDVATFDLLGTEAEPVVITSAQAEPRAGDWGCIVSPAALRIEHAIIEYAGSGQGCTGANYAVALAVSEGTTITDTVFRNISGAAFRVPGCDDVSAWCANTFEGIAEGPILCGNEATACP
jgi:hypothetical protein